MSTQSETTVIVNEKLNDMRQDTACPALTSKKVEPNSSPVLPQQEPSRRPLLSPESDSIFDTSVYPSSSETAAAVDKQPKPTTPKLWHASHEHLTYTSPAHGILVNLIYICKSVKRLQFPTKLNVSKPMGPDVSQVHRSTKDTQSEPAAVKGKNPYYQK